MGKELDEYRITRPIRNATKKSLSEERDYRI